MEPAPDLKKMAPEAYDSLRYHRSWARLGWRFVTDPTLSLYTRKVRKDRGDFRLAEELPEGVRGTGATPEFAAGPVVGLEAPRGRDGSPPS